MFHRQIAAAALHAESVADVPPGHTLDRRPAVKTLIVLCGLLVRQTADTDIPADTPPASAAFINATPFCDWLWDGAA